MIYRLDFNSKQYFSSTTIGSGSRGSMTYAVDWSFLPDNTKYKMRFSFISYRRPVTGFNGAVSSNRIEVDFGTQFNQNFTGSNAINTKNNSGKKQPDHKVSYYTKNPKNRKKMNQNKGKNQENK